MKIQHWNSLKKILYYSNNTLNKSFSNSAIVFANNKKNSGGVSVPLFDKAYDAQFKNKIAFIDFNEQTYTYGNIGGKSSTLAKEISNFSSAKGANNNIAFLCGHNIHFPLSLFGIWMSNNAGVPLSSKHPESLLEHYIKTTGAKLIVTTKEYADKLLNVTKSTNSELLVIDYDSINEEAYQENNFIGENGLILFTSGTTGKPKGVLLTHKNLEDQVTNICQAWEITSKDTMLHVLPLHHTHGLIHALISPLATGATCLMLDKYDGKKAWEQLLSSNELRPSVLMGVPTVYTKLVEEYENSYAKNTTKREFVKATCREKMRLFLCGSASLPVPVLESWKEITDHTICERYGMTEIGMALTNPLHGERRAGCVGQPFQTVNLRVVEFTNQKNYKILAESNFKGTTTFVDKKDKVIGDLLVKGPSVFKEYWQNPEATKKDFTDDGWFITGDTVEYVDGYYKIMGRKSVDIIKSGGYKLSALEIEAQLLALEPIREVAIMGLPDPTWGEKVAAVIAWKKNELSLKELRELAKTRLPNYACPSVLKTVPELPKNHLGKVNKKELVKIFEA